MASDLDEYVPRKLYAPTMAEVLSKRGIIEEEKQFSREGFAVLNGRALRWLNNAASYAYATLNVIIDLYPENDGREYRKYFNPILKELSAVVNAAREDELKESEPSKETLDRRIKNAMEAVVHANNIFNNTCLLLPDKFLKAVLEARDVCDEALGQPRMLKS